MRAMKNRRSSTLLADGARALAAGVAFALASACGPSPLPSGSEPDRVVLALVGDSDIVAQRGEVVQLGVRYLDEEGWPLFGIVDFTIVGDAPGASLSTPAATTDASGLAVVMLLADAPSGSSFRVEASALGGEPVGWNITIAGQTAPLDPRGLYRIDSRFQLGTGLDDGPLRDILEALDTLRNQPGTHLLHNAAALGLITENEAQASGPDLDALLDDHSEADVVRLRALGRHAGEVSRNLELVTTVQISGQGSALAADHVLSGVLLSFAEERHALTLDDLDLPAAEPAQLEIAFEGATNRIVFDEHALRIPYGELLDRAIFEFVLPAIDSDSDLTRFFHDHYDCGLIADWMSMEFAMDPIPADNSCRNAVSAVVEAIETSLAALAEHDLEFVISGQARAVDTSDDGLVDDLVDGTWRGAIEHGGATQATLDAGINDFNAARIGGRVD
jgi:hypothetical protein